MFFASEEGDVVSGKSSSSFIPGAQKVEAPYMTWGHKMFECHDADCCTSCKNKHGINKWISTMRSIKTQGLYLEFVWMKKNMD
ncbi:unnamed protein product [Lactuca virosa]|uniref:Uncharacterized protein n=1 Tax=Lactuca virosa TaxID=75947 RepID=A0AAU9M536_9ASTR|nr:unnamed protein product [Lactuca virosa]